MRPVRVLRCQQRHSCTVSLATRELVLQTNAGKYCWRPITALPQHVLAKKFDRAKLDLPNEVDGNTPTITKHKASIPIDVLFKHTYKVNYRCIEACIKICFSRWDLAAFRGAVADGRSGILNDVTKEHRDSGRDKMQGSESVYCFLGKGVAISAPRVR